MQDRDAKLAHALKIKFGLAPWEPNETQLALIKNAIARIRESGRVPSDEDWYSAVASVCPSPGHHRYHGLDNSDLNTLLALALQAARGRL